MKRAVVVATISTILLVVVAVVALELVGGHFQPSLFRRGYRLYAMFDNVHNLKVGDRVKTSGAEIGFVEEITLTQAARKMRVTMKIRPKVSVAIDSVAIINSEKPQQASFVELVAISPVAPAAMPGSFLMARETP